MANDRSSRLANAMRERQFVRFSRRFEDFVVHGYVLDIGPRFFLLAVVSDRLWFDGFECFRIADVRDIRPDPYAAFAEAALKQRGERVSRKPRVSLASVEELLLSANRAFPLVTISIASRPIRTCATSGVLSRSIVAACRYWRSILARPGTRSPSNIPCARSPVSASVPTTRTRCTLSGVVLPLCRMPGYRRARNQPDGGKREQDSVSLVTACWLELSAISRGNTHGVSMSRRTLCV